MSYELRRKVLIISGIVLAVGALLWFLYSINNLSDNKNMTEVIEQDTEKTEALKEYHDTAYSEMEKMEKFIQERLPTEVGILEYTIDSEIEDDEVKEEHEEETITEEQQHNLMKDEVLQMYFLAIQEEDTFMLSGFMTPGAIQSAWEGIANPDLRIGAVEDAVKVINREGTLDSFSYQYEVDKYKYVRDGGLMTFNYTDGVEITYPFEMIKTVGSEHDDDHESVTYFLNTPLADISNAVLEAE